MWGGVSGLAPLLCHNLAMSYDLTLLAVGDGEGIDEIFARMEDEEPRALPSAEMRAAFSSIADDLGSEGYEYLEGARFVNIVNDNFGSIFNLHAEGADINVAYWHSGSEAAAVMHSILDLVGRIQELTGWTLFDPQRGEIVTDPQTLLPQSAGEMDRITRWADKNIRGSKRSRWKRKG